MSSGSDLLALWAEPPSIYRSAPFWSWNALLDPDRLCRAVAAMHDAGMGGFFMHSRYGLKTAYLSDEWFACVSACVEKARELGMHAYLYDEDRWPSGAAGGAVTRGRPDYAAHVLVQTDAAAGPEGSAERVAAFAVELDDAGRLVSYEALPEGEPAPAGRTVEAFDATVMPPSPWFNDTAYLDTMSAEAVEEYIRVTHQAYADRYGEDFGDLIPAIFTDEPNNGPAERLNGRPCVRWTSQLPRQFRTRRGYDIRDHLPALFHPPADGEFSKVRCDFHRTVAELFMESFTGQIGRWCGGHKIALTGHMLAEESLASQVRSVGACMGHYEHMQWPGIDILTDQDRELVTAKQCTSVADQLGRRRVLSELYGCTGWDWPLEGHKFVGDWQLAVGVNFRCPHLTHYSLAGGAKRDYPASLFGHSPWWKYYAVVEDYYARLNVMLTRGRPVRDVLVIHPVESAWGLYGPGSPSEALGRLDEALARITRALSDGHYDWDFGDESLLARHAKAVAKGVQVGEMTYRMVIVPPALTLRSTTVELLARHMSRGGLVLFVGRAPVLVDGGPDDRAPELAGKAKTCPSPGDLLPAVEALLPRRVSITQDGSEAACCWYMLRDVQGGQVLFLQSHDRRAGRRVRVNVAGGRPVVLWDALTGGRHRPRASQSGGRIEFALDLPPTGSALMTLGLPAAGAEVLRPGAAAVETIPFEGPFDVELSEPNSFPLDTCRFRLGDEDLSPPMPTLKADALIRKRFGLSDRLGRAQQPWYLYATGVVDTASRGPCTMVRAFHVTDVPGLCRLALEGPQNFEITVNGAPAGKPDGWWVDEDIGTIDITSHLRTGENEIAIRFGYRPDVELEDMYLVGRFGVACLAAGAPAPGNMTLTVAPTRLGLGSWVGQGLDFYGGSVRYHLRVAWPGGRRRVRLRLPDVACTAAAVHVGGRTFALPWPPFAADITDALVPGDNEVAVEVIGGRKNILGPLHTPWEAWTGPAQFDPDNPKWTNEYLLTDHGLMSPVVLEVLEG